LGNDHSVRFDPALPTLVFFTQATSGPARRMESLLAHIARKERDRLNIRRVDADEHPALLRKFAVQKVPSLVLVKDKVVIDRIDGRASMPQIEKLLELHLPRVEALA
jgi:thioredoxin 2